MMTLEEIKRTTIDNIADTEIRKSDIHGYGLFALRDFRAGETICALDGQVMPWSKYEELENELKSKLGELSDYFFMEWNCLRKDALLVRPLARGSQSKTKENKRRLHSNIRRRGYCRG